MGIRGGFLVLGPARAFRQGSHRSPAPSALSLSIFLVPGKRSMDTHSLTWWVGAPVCFDKDGHECPGAECLLDPVPPDCTGVDAFGWVSHLTATAVTRSWTEVPVHITGCGIVPVATYGVRASQDHGATWSAALTIGTIHDPPGEAQDWGDVTGGPATDGNWLPPDYATSFGDVGSAIRTFENRGDGTGFPPRVWVDVEIDQVVNLSDISFVVKAFEGTAYADINLPLIGVDPFLCP